MAVFAIFKALTDPSFAFNLLKSAFISLIQFAGVSVFRAWWQTQPPIVQVFLRNFIKGTDTNVDDAFLAAVEAGAQEDDLDMEGEMASIMGGGS